MQRTLLEYAARNAPRYTSYPPASHFDARVGDNEKRAWLASVTAGERFGVYIHVPYCRQICNYCACHALATRRDEPVRDFVRALGKEIASVATALGPGVLREIHWGGGTPNILSPAQFLHIVDRLDALVGLAHVATHAVELDPRLLDEDQCRAYAVAGVTRTSLGVQDFNPFVQQAIGRLQPRAQVQQAVDMLRAHGIANINMDLMYGLPQQSKGDLLHSIRAAASMAPNRIALFGYAHVPWFKKRQRLIADADLPGTSDRMEQRSAAALELASLGYVSIGLDHFCLPDDELAVAAREGNLQRCFQGYVGSGASTIIGLGPSAISTFEQGYAQNIQAPNQWAAAIEGGGLATARGFALSQRDRLRGRLIADLMCNFRGDLRPLGGAAQCSQEIGRLNDMLAAGLVTISGDEVAIAPEGRPFCRLVAQAFDDFAVEHSLRYSKAI